MKLLKFCIAVCSALYISVSSFAGDALPVAATNSGLQPSIVASAEDITKTYDGIGVTPAVGVTLSTPAYKVMYSLDGTHWSTWVSLTNACEAVRVRYLVEAPGYESVTGSVTVTILPRQITLTSADATWQYDGQWHNAPDVTVGGGSFAPGEGYETTNMTYVSEVGTYPNEFSCWPKEGTLASNYVITQVQGTLTIRPQKSVCGVPVDWISRNFPSASVYEYQTLLAQDSDGDGYSNADEYVFGSDPNDRTSVLEMEISFYGDSVGVCYSPCLPEDSERVYTLQIADYLAAAWYDAFILPAPEYFMLYEEFPGNASGPVAFRLCVSCGDLKAIGPVVIPGLSATPFALEDAGCADDGEIAFRLVVPGTDIPVSIDENATYHVFCTYPEWFEEAFLTDYEETFVYTHTFWDFLRGNYHESHGMDLFAALAAAGSVAWECEASFATVNGECVLTTPAEVEDLVYFVAYESDDLQCLSDNYVVRSGRLPDGDYSETIGDYTWSFCISNGTAIIRPTASACCAVSPAPTGKLSVPAILGGCPVTEVDDYSFMRDWSNEDWNLTAVEFPVSIKRIGKYAFCDCDELVSLTIPDGVSGLVIDDFAFKHCALPSLTLPEGIVSIGAFAFSFQCAEYDCFTLSGTLVLPESLRVIGFGAFMTNRVERIEFKGDLPERLPIPEDMFWLPENYGYDYVFFANEGEPTTVVYSGDYADSWDPIAAEYESDMLLFVKEGGGNPTNESVVASADDVEKKYDGEPVSIDVRVQEPDMYEVLYSLDGAVWTSLPPSFVNAGTVTVWYAVSADGYQSLTNRATVTILPREVTLMSGSGVWFYDGQPHSLSGVVVVDGSFVAGEGVETTNFAVVVDVGMTPNSFDWWFSEGTLAQNYNVTVSYGTLTVNMLPCMVPGFVRAVKTSDMNFDLSFSPRTAADASNVLYAADLYSPTCPEYTQYAFAAYMWMDAGVTYLFKSGYDDRSFVKVAGVEICPAGGDDCRELSGQYVAATSGWRTIELRAWNRFGAGGASSTSGSGCIGFWYKTPYDATWQRFEDPGDGSRFRAELGDGRQSWDHTVFFDVGSGACASGDIPLVQRVMDGAPAVAPTVTFSDPWLKVVGWSEDFSSVTNDLHVLPLCENVVPSGFRLIAGGVSTENDGTTVFRFGAVGTTPSAGCVFRIEGRRASADGWALLAEMRQNEPTTDVLSVPLEATGEYAEYRVVLSLDGETAMVVSDIWSAGEAPDPSVAVFDMGNEYGYVTLVQEGQTVRFQYDTSQWNFAVGEKVGLCVYAWMMDSAIDLGVVTHPAVGYVEWTVDAGDFGHIGPLPFCVFCLTTPHLSSCSSEMFVVPRLPEDRFSLIALPYYGTSVHWNTELCWAQGYVLGGGEPGAGDRVFIPDVSVGYPSVDLSGLSASVAELECASPDFEIRSETQGSSLSVGVLTATNSTARIAVRNVSLSVREKIVGTCDFALASGVLSVPDGSTFGLSELTGGAHIEILMSPNAVKSAVEIDVGSSVGDLSPESFVVPEGFVLQLSAGSSGRIRVTLYSKAACKYTLTFELGKRGVRTGGGDLVQRVFEEDVVVLPPKVRAEEGWVFVGWDPDYVGVTSDTTFVAQYRTILPDLCVEGVTCTSDGVAGGMMTVGWTVGNRGSQAFDGTLREVVVLTSAADPDNRLILSSATWTGEVPRDGRIARNVSVTVPLKGFDGEWTVTVELQAPAGTEYGGDNRGSADGTVTIAPVPLPDLTVRMTAADLGLVAPGETVAVRYELVNDGQCAAEGPWTDILSLVSAADGESVTVGRIVSANGLGAGESRTVDFLVEVPPLVGLVGPFFLRAETDVDNVIVETDETDNVLDSSVGGTLATNLYLTASARTVAENDKSGVRMTLKRSGPVGEPLSVLLTADDDGPLAVPESVTIPAGSVSTIFTVKPVDNGVVDGSRTVTLTAMAGECRPAEVTVTVTDDEIPSLTLSLGGATLREGGDAIVATVTRELATDEPLTVYLSGVSSGQCAYPATVVIPAGEKSVTFEISAVDDETAEIGANVTLRASAGGHKAASADIAVEDDDVPGVTLTLTPDTVSEGAGATAVYALLSRTDTDQISKAITVRLTASDDSQLILRKSVTIPAYTMAARFAIGVVDNGEDDGDRDITIDGAVVIESCGCNGQPSSGDAIRAVLRIIDNDGPSLSMKADPATMKEGLDPAGYLVLTHNSTLTDDLTVRLTVDSEFADEIVVPETATVKAGESSVRIPVKTLDDGIEDGGQLVAVYAEDVDGVFAPASTWVQVSDQNLPDLTVGSVRPGRTSAIARDRLDVTMTIANRGFAGRSGKVPYALHLVSGAAQATPTDATRVLSGVYAGEIAVGESVEVQASVEVPELPGDYRLVLVIDPDDTIAELDKANNTGWSDPVSVCAQYTAVAAAQFDAYMPGGTVVITGAVTMADAEQSAAEREVEVYVLVNGTRRAYTVKSDADGLFSCEFAPANGESGHYAVGASYPGLGLRTAQDEFDIYGLVCTSSAQIWNNLVVGTEGTRTIYLKNTCGLKLTGLTVATSGSLGNCEVVCEPASEIPAYGGINVQVTLRATNPSEGTDYEKFYLLFATQEGASLAVPLYFFGISPQGNVRANPTSLASSMVVGEATLVTFDLNNTGAASSGKVSVLPPSCDWLRVVGGSTMTLAPGESGTVTLELTPTEALVLNYNYKGSLAVRCENAPDLKIPFTFIPVTDNTGRLSADVIDALTLTDPAAPHVSGAVVTVRDVNGRTVTTGTTAADGKFVTGDLRGGRYTVSVEASGHSLKTVDAQVIPGQTVSTLVYLEYNAVSYEFKVVPTEIEDQYTIEMVMDYEVNVPYPVLELSVPEEIPKLAEGEEYVVGIDIANKGLVAIQNVRLSLSGSIGDYSYEQISPNITTLAAKSSDTIFVRFSNPVKHRPSLKAAATDVDPAVREVTPCTFAIFAMGEAYCGKDFVNIFQRSPNIRLATILCDMAALMYNALADLTGGWTGGGSGGDPYRQVPGTSPVRPDIRNPVVSEQTADCACLLTVLDKFLGLTLFFKVSAENIMEGLDTMSQTTDFTSFVEGITSVKWTKLVGDKSLEDLFDHVFGAYETCKKSMGENRWMEMGAGANDLYKRLKKLWKAFKSTNDAAQNMFKSDKWKDGDNQQTLCDFLDEYLDGHAQSGTTPTWEDFSEYAKGKVTGLSEEDYDAIITDWNRIIDNIRSEKKSSGKTDAPNTRALSALSAPEREPVDPAVIIRALDAYAELRGEIGSYGVSSVAEMVDLMAKEIETLKEGTDASALCATVTLRLSQTLAMTREAFEGTLTVKNGSLTELKDFKLDLLVTDADGTVCNDLFGITPRSLEGFSGSTILSGDAVLGKGQTGVGTVLFVPTVNAAPATEKVYYFGGSFTYTDDSGTKIVTKLSPVPLVVHPSPYLKLDYFVQRDVYADDPFTPDVVEASMPAEIAVLVRNVGAGDAKNVTIDSAQPEVVANDKGVLAKFSLRDYTLDGSALNGASKALGVTQVNLGTIAASESKVAQWWFSSTIDGHFSGISATVTPVNSWGNPDTSLVDDNVGMHKLIRSLAVDGETLPYFLTSEVNDIYGKPDTVFAPDGDVLPVRTDSAVAVKGLLSGAQAVLHLTVSAKGDGWTYVSHELDGASRYTLVSVRRSDGSEVSLRNVWLTDKRFRNGLTPLVRDELHLVDTFGAAGDETYEIVLSAKPTDAVEVSAFEDVANGAAEHRVRDSLTVVFSAAVDPATFTVDDLTLIRQGAYVDDLSALTIAAVAGDDTRFTVGNLSALCSEFGRYELTVQCTGIADARGLPGAFGKSVAWTYSASDAPYVVGVEGIPAKPVAVLDEITVTVSTAVDPASFSAATILLNGENVSGLLTIRAVDAEGTVFAISGLEALQTLDGEYELSIAGGDLRSVDGTPGISTFVKSWCRDTVPPVLQDVERGTSLDGTSFRLVFSEPVSGLSLASVSLTRDGQAVALPPSATLSVGTDGTGTFAGADSVLLQDGAYELSVDSSGAVDAAGNVASGIRSVAWTVDTTPPGDPTGLTVSSDYGSVGTTVYTGEASLTLSGVVPEPEVTVQILCRFADGSESLLASPPVGEGGAFSADLALPESGGSFSIVVRLADASGNASETEIRAYYDKIALTAAFGDTPREDVVAERIDLTFSDEVLETDVSSDKWTLTRDGATISLDGVAFCSSDKQHFFIEGLKDVCNVDGNYTLSFDADFVRKRMSGLKTPIHESVSWRYECPDRDPPIIATVLIDGEAARSVYTNGISSVAVAFNEEVNLSTLVADGLVGQALTIQRIDANGVVTGVVRAVASEVTCSATEITWTLSAGAVGRGPSRLVIDSGLVADLAGNKLAATGFDSVAGLRFYSFASETLATVASYAMPTWYDCDGDGLGDLVVGEKTTDGDGKVRIYRNVGTLTEPRFNGYTYLKVGDSDLSIAANGCQGAQVAFGDLTGDGYDDLIVGFSSGKVQLWHGTSVCGVFGESEILLTGSESTYGSLRAFVCPYDLDGDGKLELVVGGIDGKFRKLKYASGGYSTETWLTDSDGAPLEVSAGRSTPVLVDVNNDGCVDIMTGDTTGNVWVYLGDGHAWNSTAISLFDNATAKLSDRSRIGYADVNGDGVGDLLVGRTDGTVVLALGNDMKCPSVAFGIVGQYSVSFEVGEHGTRCGGGELSQTVYQGEAAVAPEVEPDYGWLFDGWDKDFGNVTESLVVTARWSRVKWPIVVNNPDGTATTNLVDHESKIVVSAPEPTVDALCKTQIVYLGSSLTAPAVKDEFEIAATAAVTVNWDVLATNYWFETSETAKGSVGDEVAGWKSYGATFTLVVTPDEHHHLVRWTGDVEYCEEVSGGLLVTMDRARQIGAEFAIDTFDVAFDLNGHGTRTGGGELSQTVDYGGAAVAPEIEPDYGWLFDRWDKGFDKVTESFVVTACWSRVKWPVVVNNPDGTATTNLVDHESKIVVSAPEPTVDALCKTQIVYLGSSLTAPAVKDEFEITATAAVMVNWDVLATNYWFETSETADGSVGDESAGWKSCGAAFTLVATPDEHHHLVRWTGDVEGCEEVGGRLLVTMDRARQIGAEFEIDSHAVVIGGGMESTIPSAGVYDYTYGSMATVVVVNAVQYYGATQFVCKGWSATNTEPADGAGTQAVFKVIGDAQINWIWQTNVLTLAESVNAMEMAFETEGAAEWSPEWTTTAFDGLHQVSVYGLANNSSAYMETKVVGAGTISFSWCSRLASRNTKLQFMLDDSPMRMLSGTNGWTSASVTIMVGGEHTLKWRLITGRTGASADDFAALDNVLWEPKMPSTLAEALNTNLVWKTGGAANWSGVDRESVLEERESWAQVSGLGDNGTSWISTRVYGSGVLTFDWAVSCEEEYDWIEFSVDGEVLGYLDGESGWIADSIQILGEGWHDVRWEYVKDIMDDPELAGDNLAMLDNVAWISKDVPPSEPEKVATENTPVPVPYSELENRFKSYLDAANGDYEAAALAIGKNGCPIWESFVAGLDPDKAESKFTAKIEIVDGKPVVTWEPALNGKDEDGACIKEGVRLYQLKGSTNLKDWVVVPDDGEAAYNFFKVDVTLPSAK